MSNWKSAPSENARVQVLCRFRGNDHEPHHVEYWLGEHLLLAQKFVTLNDAQPLLDRLASVGILSGGMAVSETIAADVWWWLAFAGFEIADQVRVDLDNFGMHRPTRQPRSGLSN